MHGSRRIVVALSSSQRSPHARERVPTPAAVGPSAPHSETRRRRYQSSCGEPPRAARRPTRAHGAHVLHRTSRCDLCSSTNGMVRGTSAPMCLRVCGRSWSSCRANRWYNPGVARCRHTCTALPLHRHHASPRTCAPTGEARRGVTWSDSSATAPRGRTCGGTSCLARRLAVPYSLDRWPWASSPAWHISRWRHTRRRDTWSKSPTCSHQAQPSSAALRTVLVGRWDCTGGTQARTLAPATTARSVSVSRVALPGGTPANAPDPAA